MRYIKIPKTVQIKDASGLPMTAVIGKNDKGQDVHDYVTVTMYNFLTGTLLKAQCFCSNAMVLHKAIKFAEKVEEANDESYIEVDDSFYDLLKEACESTETPFRADIALQFGPFLESILEAPTEQPEKKSSVTKKKVTKKVSKKKASRKTK